MKRITILLTVSLFTFTALAQEKINWLNIIEFEKAIKKEKQNVFIFIEQDRVNENMPKDE
jgi:thioredoxin-related protein